jgi:hypothetical protein
MNKGLGQLILWLYRTVTGRTVKVAAILGLDSPEAFGDALDPYNPRQLILRRKQRNAARSATAAPKIFNPMVAGHPANMRQRRPGSSPEGGLTLSVERHSKTEIRHRMAGGLIQTLALSLSIEPAYSTFALPKLDEIAADNLFGLFDCRAVVRAINAHR